MVIGMGDTRGAKAYICHRAYYSLIVSCVCYDAVVCGVIYFNSDLNRMTFLIFATVSVYPIPDHMSYMLEPISM